MLQHKSEFTFFLRLNDTPLYVYTTLCLVIPGIILLNAFFFIYSYGLHVWGKRLKFFIPSSSDTCLLAQLKFILVDKKGKP